MKLLFQLNLLLPSIARAQVALELSDGEYDTLASPATAEEAADLAKDANAGDAAIAGRRQCFGLAVDLGKLVGPEPGPIVAALHDIGPGQPRCRQLRLQLPAAEELARHRCALLAGPSRR